MAFRVNVTYECIEFRGIQSGTSRESGRPWMSLVLEDSETNQISVSVPQDLQGDVYSLGLRKGDEVAVSFVAVARADGNSYLQLSAAPELLEDED